MLTYQEANINNQIEWAKFQGSVYVYMPFTEEEQELPALEFLSEQCGHDPESLEFVEYEHHQQRFIFHLLQGDNSA